jgi:Dimethlysulfonioproprionate lyase
MPRVNLISRRAGFKCRGMSEELYNDARWLIGAMARGLHARGGGAVDSVLGRLSEQDLTRACFIEPRPQNLPVTRYFAQTIAEAMMLEADIAAAMATLDGHLKWCQSSSYADAILGDGFLQNYGWCEIVGPKGFFKGDDFILGLLMLGPNCHYKDHYHPAPELYWPLTGSTQWKKGKGGFVPQSAGKIIFHHPNEIHATKTADHPMLAVWSWTKDTDVPAKLVEG